MVIFIGLMHPLCEKAFSQKPTKVTKDFHEVECVPTQGCKPAM